MFFVFRNLSYKLQITKKRYRLNNQTTKIIEINSDRVQRNDLACTSIGNKMLFNARSSYRGYSIKRRGVPKNLTKFTGKHLCQSLFFKKALS